jgi:hypothetical protein
MALGRPEQAAAVLSPLFREQSNAAGKGEGDLVAAGAFVIQMSPLQCEINDQQEGSGVVNRRGKGKSRRQQAKSQQEGQQQQQHEDGQEQEEDSQRMHPAAAGAQAAGKGSVGMMAGQPARGASYSGGDENMMDAAEEALYDAASDHQEGEGVREPQLLLMGATRDGEAPSVVSACWGEPQEQRAFYTSVRRCLLLYLQVRFVSTT